MLVERGVDIASPFDDGVTPAGRAATTGHPELARYLVELGAPAPDLDPGQRFVAAADPWQTALHVAAMDGRLDLARSLLRLGADPDIRDQRFDSTRSAGPGTSARRSSSRCSSR